MKIEDLKKEIENQKKFITGCLKDLKTIEQILGEALGYPTFNSLDNGFESDDICVFTETPVTLAYEISNKINEYRNERNKNE
jgi:hypothetical protein